MARKVFYSFHYKPDVHRVSLVRQMGVIEGQPVLASNKWEEIRSRGKAAIEAWITRQMRGKSCVVVLIGSGTAGRPWVDYEIEKGWNDGKGLVGVHINSLKGIDGGQSAKGANPFDGLTVGADRRPLSSIVKTYGPRSSDSKVAYAVIQKNLPSWVEEAVAIRARY
jgi:MTH538 TIR-like domain (DUF1863)